ncbi:Origin recognition complex subunit 1 [Galdieria sulphuraria]|nr:Origin recognition complex subunit 1 [Galdieria sulphuraria]
MQSAGKRRVRTTTRKQKAEKHKVTGSNSRRKTKRRKTQTIAAQESSLPERIYIVRQVEAERNTFSVPFVEVLQTRDKKGSKISRKRIQVLEDIETTISIGDTVLLCSDREDFPFIARVEDIIVKPRVTTAQKKQQNWQHGKNCSMWLSLRWFYQPFEIVVPSEIAFDDDDVLLSNHIDKNSIECYLDKCQIAFPTEKPVDSHCPVFKCRYFYDCITTNTRSLKMEDKLILLQTHSNSGFVRNKEAKLLLKPLDNDLADSRITTSVLVGREPEIERIKEFLTQSILDVCQGRSKGERSLYINGVPGTGKTASVLNLSLWKSMKFVGSMKAAQQLDRYFGEDVLLSRKQKVVYDFLEWCARENSPLVVVAIANTMDLPERVLQPRIGSRLGVNRLSFSPYSSAQLRNILDSQIPVLLHYSLDKFESLALELCCKKVASVTGDVRRALHVCQRAIEVAQSEGSDLVRMTHIQEAFVTMYSRGPVLSVAQLSLAEKVVYCAALLCERHYGADSIFLARLVKHALELSQRLSLHLDLETGKILEICCNLSFSRHITLQWNAVESFNKILCNVQFDDFCYAVQGTVFYDILNNLLK